MKLANGRFFFSESDFTVSLESIFFLKIIFFMLGNQNLILEMELDTKSGRTDLGQWLASLETQAHPPEHAILSENGTSFTC